MKTGKSYKQILKSDPDHQTQEKRRKIYKAINNFRKHADKHPVPEGRLVMAFNVNTWEKVFSIHDNEIEEVRKLLRKLRENRPDMTLEEQLLDDETEYEI